MVKTEDLIIAISNSGEADEVLKLLPFLRENGNQIIAIIGKLKSTLVQNSHCHLNIAVPQEGGQLVLENTPMDEMNTIIIFYQDIGLITNLINMGDK